MDQQDLIAKLLRIEALHAGATTPGERMAAGNARERILERLRHLTVEDPPVEMQFSLPDPWTRKLFLAIARRYGLKPYRLPRQKAQSVMLRVPQRFLDETLWPEYTALAAELRAYLEDVTERVIRDGLGGDSAEAQEMRALPPPKP